MVLLLCLSACGGAPSGEGHLQLQLPKALREISGLALYSGETLLAIADEKAHVFLIDTQNQRVESITQFGDPVARGDFEGIAYLADRVFTITSSGVIWAKGLNDPPQQHQVYETGLGEQCEIEGLTAWPEHDQLLILCKKGRKSTTRNRLIIYSWSVKTAALVATPLVDFAYADMGLSELRPSGITFTADRQGLFVIAARERAFVELDLNGQVLRSQRFPFPDTHPQAEGVEITASNTLYLADEGGKGRGTVTRYAPSF